jgi:hypothetical protein
MSIPIIFLSHRRGGHKAHGPVIRDYSIGMNRKVSIFTYGGASIYYDRGRAYMMTVGQAYIMTGGMLCQKHFFMPEYFILSSYAPKE